MISIIVAFDENRAMGKNGGLPWPIIRDDMKFFQNITSGHTVIMGHNTWRSLPKKPLKNRLNILLSNGDVSIPSEIRVLNNTRTIVSNNFNGAITYSKDYHSGKDIFIIGGLQIYQLALSEGIVDQIIVSRIDGKHEADLFFPELGQEWVLDSDERRDGFNICIYRKGACYE